jgi:hypothetical protein
MVLDSHARGEHQATLALTSEGRPVRRPVGISALRAPDRPIGYTQADHVGRSSPTKPAMRPAGALRAQTASLADGLYQRSPSEWSHSGRPTASRRSTRARATVEIFREVVGVALNRGQRVGLNVGYSVAVRTTYFVEALLDLCVDRAGESRLTLEPILRKLEAYRALADELDQHFELGGDPHDLRPIILDQIYRLRDALNPRLADELANFGRLDPADADFLRARLATLSMMVDELAREAHRLPIARI